MKPIRRNLCLSLAAVLTGAARPVLAQPAAAYPIAGKPIRILVPFTPGGQADTLGRAMGTRLGEALGVPVIVDFKPGASTALGALEVQRSAADGHTLLFTNGLTYAQNPHLRSKLTYDPKGYTAVFQLVEAFNVLIANPAVPANSVAELVAHAKANPGKVSFASIGIGGGAHLLAELFMQRSGISMNHIPYKGSADANRDLWGGQVDILFDGLGSAIPGLQAKRVKALGMATKARVAALPDVPTFSEQGVPGVDLSGFIGFFGPPDMPEVIVTRLNAEMQKILESPGMAQVIQNSGNSAAGGPAARFARTVAEQSETWGEVVRKIGLKLE